MFLYFPYYFGLGSWGISLLLLFIWALGPWWTLGHRIYMFLVLLLLYVLLLLFSTYIVVFFVLFLSLSLLFSSLWALYITEFFLSPNLSPFLYPYFLLPSFSPSLSPPLFLTFPFFWMFLVLLLYLSLSARICPYCSPFAHGRGAGFSLSPMFPFFSPHFSLLCLVVSELCFFCMVRGKGSFPLELSLAPSWLLSPLFSFTRLWMEDSPCLCFCTCFFFLFVHFFLPYGLSFTWFWRRDSPYVSLSSPSLLTWLRT